MSAQRVVSAPQAATRPVARRLPGWRGALALVAAGLVGATATGCGAAPSDYVVVRSTAPDGRSAAEVRLSRCGSDWCHTLWVGPQGGATLLATLPASSERCHEIAWSPDSLRSGFLINGYQLRLYDAVTHAPAGQLDLVPADGSPARLARGVTFSENGAAVTYDDCPRDRSGCRPGLVAIR